MISVKIAKAKARKMILFKNISGEFPRMNFTSEKTNTALPKKGKIRNLGIC